MLLGLSESLPHLVNAKFNVAKAAQHLLFSPTELAIIRTTTDVPVSKLPPLPLQVYLCINLVQVSTAVLPSSGQETYPLEG